MKTEILNNTLDEFVTAFEAGWGNLHDAIVWLSAALLAIELVMIGLWWALAGGEQLVNIMKKVMYLLVWLWIVQSFPTLAKAFVHSLAEAGEIAGGRPGTHTILMDPSSIIGSGFEVAMPLAKAIGEQGWDVADGLAYAIMWLFTCLAFIIIAWQMFYCVLEFYLVLSLVGILLPFGFFEPTKFLAEKSIGAIIASGVKMMVLSFIVAVSLTIINGIPILDDIPNLETGMTMVLISGAIAFLAWNAPGIAAGLVSGSPSLSVSTAASQATAVGVGATAALGGGAVAASAASKFTATKMATLAGSSGKIGSMAGQMSGMSKSGGKAAGKVVAQSSKATGKAMQVGGEAVAGAGKGMQSAGAAITSTSVPVVSQVAGAAVTAAGAATQAAGKAMSAAGKAVEKTGEVAGKGIEKAGAAAGKGIEKAGDAAGRGVEKTAKAAGEYAKKPSKAPEWAKKALDTARTVRDAVPSGDARPYGGDMSPRL